MYYMCLEISAFDIIFFSISKSLNEILEMYAFNNLYLNYLIFQYAKNNASITDVK